MSQKFLSGQQTTTMFNFFNNYDFVRASAPQFNRKLVKNDEKLQDQHDLISIKNISLPVYSTRLMESLYRLFTTSEIVQFAKNQNVTLPVWRFNKMFTKRVGPYKDLQYGAVQPLLDYLSSNREEKSVERICLFLDQAVKFVNEDPTVTEWFNLTDTHFPIGWREKTHYDTVLQLFGVSDSVARNVARNVNMTHSSVRWIVQAMNCLTLVNPNSNVGCFTDVVNGIFAMMDEFSVRDGDPAVYISSRIDYFTSSLQNEDFLNSLWIPKYHYHDAENDDMLLNMLFKYVRVRNTSDPVSLNTETCSFDRLEPLKTFVQLPTNTETFSYDALERYFTSFEHTSVFRDPDSANHEALLTNWGSEYVRTVCEI